MNAMKSHYCRWLIKQPGYYRNRATQMGEQFGVWTAEAELRSRTPSRTLSANYFNWIADAEKTRDRYRDRMRWYTKRYSRQLVKGAKDYDESMDYES